MIDRDVIVKKLNRMASVLTEVKVSVFRDEKDWDVALFDAFNTVSYEANNILNMMCE